MHPIVVVGGGISGIACARAVSEAGLPVQVRDRGRRLGGRMASRRTRDRPVDTGASYFTVSETRFGAVVERWRAEGLAREWTDTFSVLERDSDGEVHARSTSGPVRWGGTAGLRALVEALAVGLEVAQTPVQEVRHVAGGLLVDGDPASAVVLAMPDPQARRLLGSGLEEERGVLDMSFDPVLAHTTVWDERRWDLDGAFVNGDDDLAWLADDGRRRGDGAPVLVAHSTPDLAARHLDDPSAAEGAMLAALRHLLGLRGEPGLSEVRRWTYAKPTGNRESPFLLSERGLGACGDSWSSGAKVQGAYLSGLALGEELADRVG